MVSARDRFLADPRAYIEDAVDVFIESGYSAEELEVVYHPCYALTVRECGLWHLLRCTPEAKTTMMVKALGSEPVDWIVAAKHGYYPNPPYVRMEIESATIGI